MYEYKFAVANDNGNSEHKIVIGKTVYRYPNVYSIIYSDPGQSDDSLDIVIANLHKNMDVLINSRAVSPMPNRYLVGTAALSSQNQNDLYNMDVTNVKKHEETLPVINTLAIIATESVKRHYHANGDLVDGDTIKVQINMTTALPASIHDAQTEKEFSDKFTKHLHEVKVYIKDLTINVQIRFEYVKVVKEGIPALFAIIEDGKGNYREDSMFDQFKEEYEHEDLDGSYFLDRRLLHVDIGDGSTELVFTEGYTADPIKSSGEKFGLGQAIEKASDGLSTHLRIDVSRQTISEYLKDKKHKFHRKAMEQLLSPKQEVSDKVFSAIKKRLGTLAYEVDVIVVYGGASILLEDILYKPLVEFCKEFQIEVLWIPEEFAVDMNVQGMRIFNSLKLNELAAAARK